MDAPEAVRFDSVKIIRESQLRIKKSLIEGFEYDHLVIAKSDKFLREHRYQKLDFAVMYVDLINSTKLSTELAPDFLSKLIMVYSQEVSFIVEKFDGLVLKFVGDAVIGYFPHTENLDDVVLCGKAIINIVRNAINPLLLQMGHGGIRVKITSDYGQHTIVRYGSDPKRSHIDLISITMNLAAKMQSVTEADHMVIGKELYHRLDHHKQQIIFEKLDSGKIDWNYHASDGREPYQLYVTNF